MSRSASLAALFIALIVATSCARGDLKRESTPKRCEHDGDTCEFAPGKLGICVAPEGCTQSRCLICQSQH